MIPIVSLNNGRYHLRSQVSSGISGRVYEGLCQDTRESIALKFFDDEKKMENEADIYKHISGATGFPLMRHCASEKGQKYIVSDLLGKSLHTLFCMCRNSFSLKTVLIVVDQMLQRIQYLHEKGIVHCDLKPENFAIGTERRSNQLYIFDFGLSEYYLDVETRKLHPQINTRVFKGTPAFAPISSHSGLSPSRKDDLESLGYVMTYLYEGSLPWSLYVKPFDNERILTMKKRFLLHLQSENIPVEFYQYFAYVQSLDFDSEPDYSSLRSLFRDLFVRNGFVYDNCMDWDSQRRLSMVYESPSEKSEIKKSKSGPLPKKVFN